jgi:lysophospholipase L1-like esterase
LLVEGTNTKLLGCKVVTHAYGHGIVMQGAVNTLVKDCYVEGKMRTTNEILAETSGLAFDVGFKSDYPPGKIMPNEIKSLSEDGIRTYPAGGLNGRRTQGITVINCTVKNMRSGFDLSANLAPTKIIGSTAIGCQEKGYSIGTDGVIEKSKGDALYGPLITFIDKDVRNCKVNLELINTVSEYNVSRLAEINGSGHKITIRNYQGKKRSVESPIVFGESFWADVHQFRKPKGKYGDYAGAKNIKLFNYTGMPVRLNDLSINCTVSNAVKSNKKQVINAGVGGNTSGQLLARIDKDVLNHKPDLVIMMVGTNDMLNSKKMVAYSEYTSNLKSLIKKIKSSGSELVLMSSIPADSAYLFQRHNKKIFKEAPNFKIDKVGDIIKDLTAENKVYYYDLNSEFKALNLPQHNRDVFIKNLKNSGKGDGVHPTSLGYRFIAQNVYYFLKENGLLKPRQKIICFGDSITKGGKDGANYPSYLSELIKR